MAAHHRELRSWRKRNSYLPTEMLEKVFSHLAPKDLKTVMLVCKTWNNAGGRPSLWSWVKITSSSQLRLKRLQGARELTIKGNSKGSWHTLLRAIHQHPSIKKINFGSCWLFTETELLTKGAKIEEIEVNSNGGTKYVLDTILQRPNNLKKLVVWNFHHVDLVHLATALNKIEVLEVRLSSEQANLLFMTMKDSFNKSEEIAAFLCSQLFPC